MRTDAVNCSFFQYLNPFKFFRHGVFLTQKEHDLQNHKDGHDYFLTVINDGNMTACITIQGLNVRLEDYILVKIKGELIRYKIEEIDYFAEPSDMCMMALHKIESRVVETEYVLPAILPVSEECSL